MATDEIGGMKTSFLITTKWLNIYIKRIEPI
ncbi:MAG: hypothetical protein ACI8X3_000519 [Saprospiraceae bacterium]